MPNRPQPAPPCRRPAQAGRNRRPPSAPTPGGRVGPAARAGLPALLLLVACSVAGDDGSDPATQIGPDPVLPAPDGTCCPR